MTGVTPRNTGKFPRESPGSSENLRCQTCARAVPAASLYGDPENCPMLRIRTRYSLTCSSRSSAALANPLISRVFSSPIVDASPCGSVSTAEPLFFHTCRTSVPVVPCLRPDALSCAVRAPPTLWRHGKGGVICVAPVLRTYDGRVPIRTHSGDFKDLADSKVRRRVRRTAIHLARSSSLSPTASPGGHARRLTGSDFSMTAPARQGCTDEAQSQAFVPKAMNPAA